MYSNSNSTASSHAKARTSFLQCVTDRSSSADLDEPFLIGVLEGEGIGAEVVRAALDVLGAVSEAMRTKFVVEHGGPIGRASEKICGSPLSSDVVGFCRDIFARGGVLLAGAGGGRFVYDLRREFDLYCKVVPIESYVHVSPAGANAFVLSEPVDMVMVRENTGGIYQGTWSSHVDPGRGRVASHSFSYTEEQVARILEVGARIASTRAGRMCVVWKESGVPSISSLWKDCAAEAGRKYEVEWSMMDIDYAAYWMLREASRIDVVVAPNMFGDVLGDMCGILQGSRGMTYSGNFNAAGHAVYQTNHGAAYDLAGTNTANPIGQIRSAAMMLRESFGLVQQADVIDESVREVLLAGWRTPDVASANGRAVGTVEFTEKVTDAIRRRKASGVMS